MWTRPSAAPESVTSRYDSRSADICFAASSALASGAISDLEPVVRQNSAVDIGAHAASSAAITGCWHHASHRAELLVESARIAARGATRSAVEELAIIRVL